MRASLTLDDDKARECVIQGIETGSVVRVGVAPAKVVNAGDQLETRYDGERGCAIVAKSRSQELVVREAPNGKCQSLSLVVPVFVDAHGREGRPRSDCLKVSALFLLLLLFGFLFLLLLVDNTTERFRASIDGEEKSCEEEEDSLGGVHGSKMGITVLGSDWNQVWIMSLCVSAPGF